MKIAKALEIGKDLKKYNQKDIKLALIVLTSSYKILKNVHITNTKNIFDQKDLDKFFKMVDTFGCGENFEYVNLRKLRAWFSICFKGKYQIPNFPAIDEVTKKERKKSTK